MKDIFKIIKVTSSFKYYYIGIGILIITTSLLNLAGPFLNKLIVDLLLNDTEQRAEKLVVLLGIVLLVDATVTFVANISGYYGDILSSKLNTYLAKRYYKHVLALQVEYFDNEVSGAIMNKLQRGIDQIASFIGNMLNNFLPFFLTAIFTVISISFYSVTLAFLLAILFPIYVIISDRSSKSWLKHQHKINGIQDQANGRVLESINAIRVVKSFIKEKLEYRNFSTSRADIEKITKTQSRGWHLFDVGRGLVLNIILFSIYAYIVYFTFVGRFTVSELILLTQLVTQARFPLFAMSYILEQIQRAQAGSKDFFEVIATEIKIKDKPGASKLKDVKGKIEFNNVEFAYSGGAEVIKKISFELNPGEKLALVGESGEGKSTIANLLLRFYEPQGGEIKIDGININDVTQNSLHANIGVVLQETFLFSGSIFENIAYGKPGATEKEIIAAAKAANAHDFITGFADGYKTEVGERGVKLSGGQKQRLSIARAILKDAPILVLDEATSALDSKAEKEVQEALEELMAGRTTIIIAHRLATIKNVDHIVVIKKGKIAEEGSPRELIKQNGIYASLVKLQSTLADANPQDIAENKTLQEYQLTV